MSLVRIGRCVTRRAGMMLVVLSLNLAGTAMAQRDLSKVEIETIPLGSGLAMLVGAGGNIGVSTGPDGTLLIDDQFAPLTKKIEAAVSALSPGPIRFLLNTHWHGDHTGGNENLGKAGVLIMAHEQVRARLATDRFVASRNETLPAAAKEAWPVVTFEDGLTLHLNGQTIEVRHVEPAHTDGDSIVRFVEADVIHMGDTYFSGIYPYIDTTSGGGIDGMIAATDAGLAWAGPDTRIIPGHGPLSRPADLRKTREMLVSIRDRVRKMKQRGLDRREVIRARPSKSFDGEFGGGFMTPERFVGAVFDGMRE